MSKGKEVKGENMALLIERIITTERSESDSFIDIQMKRLKELKRMEQKKMQGVKIQKNKIIINLKGAGILDSNGNLASPYCEEK